jgi:uncharacterized protein (TIGR02099 family)
MKRASWLGRLLRWGLERVQNSPLGPALRQGMRPFLRWWRWPLLVLTGLVLCAGLLLRYGVLPQVQAHRGDIEAALSQALQRPVRFEAISAGWGGWHPQLQVSALTLHDEAGHPALTLDHVDARIAWSSLWAGQLRLAALHIEAPQLDLRRDRQGRLLIAGLAASENADNTQFMPWLLAQERIVVHQASLRWRDERRQAPPLILSGVDVDLRNTGDRHEWEWHAQPPPHLGGRMSISGDWRGHWPSSTPAGTAPDWAGFADWQGQLSVRLSRVDVRALLPWVDLPPQVEGGVGDVTAILRKTESHTVDIAADVSLGAVRARLSPPHQEAFAQSVKGHLEWRDIPWAGDLSLMSAGQWQGKLAFENAQLEPHGRIPGFSGLSGQIEGDQRAGQLTLHGERAHVDLPAVFAQSRIALTRMVAALRWNAVPQGMKITLTQAKFSNEDATGEAAGGYVFPAHGEGLGSIDLVARLQRAAGSAVWRYIPRVVSADVSAWLRDAVRAGQAENVVLKLRGDLAQFPFKNPSDGVFHIEGRFHDALLRYGTQWPEIHDIKGDLLFEGARMRIRAQRGTILGAQVIDTEAVLPDLESTDEVIHIQGQARGPTAAFLDFIRKSPVTGYLEGVTDAMSATGTGALDLQLELPLRRLHEAKIGGDFRFQGNSLVPYTGVPPLSDLAGQIQFTGNTIQAHKITGTWVGAPFSATIAADEPGVTVLRAGGVLKPDHWRPWVAPALMDRLSGAATWQGALRLKGRQWGLRFESSLKGFSSMLPVPLRKAAAETWRTVLEVKPVREAVDIRLQMGTQIRAWLRQEEGLEPRGTVAIGGEPGLPPDGLQLSLDLPGVNLDELVSLAQEWNAGVAPSGTSPAPVGSNRLRLRSPVVRVFNQGLNDVHLSAFRSGSLWYGQLESREAAGVVQWDSTDLGRVNAHLERLNLDTRAGDGSTREAPDPEDLPAMALNIDHCVVDGKALGRIALNAEHDQRGVWVGRAQVDNPDAHLDADIRWQATRSGPETRLDFTLDSAHLERLFARLGVADALRGGKAHAQGKLDWRGTPLTPNEKTMNGRFELLAENGQFKKLDPGAGRLLGVLSLQSLPRRITLDFRDVFSEGFAFDRISTQARIREGVAQTDALTLSGPAAKILMAGTVDLREETQNLKVRVQPALGETLTTGALLIHPVAGGAAWLFNRLFGQPLDQLFAYDYQITGTWSDPTITPVATHTPKGRGGPASDASPAPGPGTPP